jgi:hypothetical protein
LLSRFYFRYLRRRSDRCPMGESHKYPFPETRGRLVDAFIHAHRCGEFSGSGSRNCTV